MKFAHVAMVAFSLFLCVSVNSAQTAANQARADKPKTELETFQEKYGAVIVQGYTRGTPMRGLGGSFTVIAKQWTNAASGVKIKGLVVEIDPDEKYASSARSFIEYGEIDSLIKGITFVSKIDKSTTTLENFEAQYKTKDDFSVNVFSDSNGKLSAAIQVGVLRKAIYVDVAALADLTAKLLQAKGILDTL